MEPGDGLWTRDMTWKAVQTSNDFAVKSDRMKDTGDAERERPQSSAIGEAEDRVERYVAK